MYLTFYISIVSVMLVACPKEVPTAPCKNMDSSGTKCLDGAQQVSEPTAAQPPQAGMTSAQMLQLLTALQEKKANQVTYGPNATLGQAIVRDEAWYRSEKLRLEGEIATARNNNDASVVTMKQNELAAVERELTRIEQLKNPSTAKYLQGVPMEYCQQVGVEKCLEGGAKILGTAFNGVKSAVTWFLNRDNKSNDLDSALGPE